MCFVSEASSGWLGPDDDKDGNQYWSKSNVMFSMIQYMEGHPASAPQLTKVLKAYLAEFSRRLEKVPLSDWSAARW